MAETNNVVAPRVSIAGFRTNDPLSFQYLACYAEAILSVITPMNNKLYS
jgi:hypothetical protein